MEIRPIRSEEDHKAALAEIGRLWGAEIGTEDGDRLDILLALVEKYEETRWPVSEPNSGAGRRSAACDR
jgi:HTH-type transcriptional regulator / antitoxin HigA